MSDLPNPSAGGSYTRDDATGELTRVAGPSDDLSPANVPEVVAEIVPATPADAPPPEPAKLEE